MYLKSRHLCARIMASFIILYTLTNICVLCYAMVAPPIEHPISNEVIKINKSIIKLNSFSNEPEVMPTIEPTPTPEPTVILTPTPTPVIEEEISKYSKKDIALLERVTMSEASTQSFDVQVAVAQTVINRLHSGKYGKSLYKIVHSPNQFSTANNGKPNKQVKDAVKAAINNSPYPSNMYYFREGHYHKWKTVKNYKKIGAFYFSLANKT